MIQELEKVAQLTREEAKRLLTEEILDSTRHDVAVQVRNLEQQAKDEADMNAKKIILIATGKSKEKVVNELIYGEVSEDLPCSILKSHPDVTIYVDKEINVKGY